MDRREFLNKTSKFLFTSSIFVPALGILRPKHADPFMFLQTPSTGVPGVSWANWDWTSEEALVNGSDGDDVILALLMENTVIGGNETGVSGVGLSGADLVATQNGNLAGSDGTWRAFDHLNDFMIFTTVALDNLVNESAWTIIMKIKDIGNVTAVGRLLAFQNDAGASELLNLDQMTDEKLRVTLRTGGVDHINALTTTSAMNQAGTYYVVMATDGSDCMGGFTTTNPTKLSDFAANNRKTNNSGATIGAGSSFVTSRHIFADNAGANNGWGSLAGMVIAKKCFIDLGA